MKKLMTGIMVCLLTAAVLGCGGGGKYAEAQKLIGEQTGAMEKFTAAMDKAVSADQAAAALNALAAAMEKMAPKMAELSQKYPELKDQQAPPEEIKASMEKLEKAAMGFMGALMKAAQQFGEDPKVAEAQARLQKAMQAGQ
jgi:hypothetical protein